MKFLSILINDEKRSGVSIVMKKRAAVFHSSMHLEADKLGLPEPDCSFCGGTNRETVCLLQNDPDVFLVECANCHADSASRMPTDYVLSDYYSDTSHKITFQDASRFGKYLATNYLRYQSDSYISILDFGGDKGAVSHAVALELLKRGVDKIDISVVDYNEEVILPQDNRISITREGTLENISCQYSFVVASAVIEHIPKPRGMLDGCLTLLKKGGIFYARTPYLVPLMRMCDRVGVKLNLFYPSHVHDLGQQFWETYFDRIVSVGNFKILQSKPSIVETTFKKDLLKTMVAYFLKAPWYLIGQSYKLVGGWEVFVEKR